MKTIKGALIAAAVFGSSLALAGSTGTGGAGEAGKVQVKNCTCSCEQPATGGAGQAGTEESIQQELHAKQKQQQQQSEATGGAALGSGTYQDQKSGGSVKPGGNKTHSSITSAKRNQIAYPGKGGAGESGQQAQPKEKKVCPPEQQGQGGSGSAGQEVQSNDELQGEQPSPYSSPGINP